ncbi:MAG TPA: class III extradiol ring-cleavage dioxygenase [Polyangiaceae bacterium]|nr:class III extradiol ring-cleavage dioxygenase [Polyangiaceae bacterium]
MIDVERAAVITRRQVLSLAAASAVASLGRRAWATGEPMPCAFVGHGSPRLAIDPVRGPELRAWGASLPQPRGVVVLTPHYRAEKLTIGHVGKGRGLYSFPAFMRSELPAGLDYPSPDNAALASTVRDLLAPLEPTVDPQRAGFDHTSWMPLHHMLPKADVPVVELALPFAPEAELFTLGKRLAPLRHEGVLILASGNATHNLASIDVHAATPANAPRAAWAVEFDAWLAKTLAARDVAALLDWRKRAPSAWLAHPDDGGHYRVMLVALGAAVGGATTFESARFPVEGFEAPTLSKRCVELR